MKTIILKVSVGGDGGIGKTTFLHRYCTDTFLADTKLTVGVDFLTKIVERGELKYNFAIWDLGGQQQFRFILSSYVRGAHAGLLFFSLERTQSFINLPEWLALLRSQKADLPVVLVGTKADLEDPEMRVSDADIEAYVRENNILAYIRTSSKTGENIAHPVEVLAEHFSKIYKT